MLSYMSKLTKILSLLCFLTPALNAQVLPSRSWKTISVAEFEVIYDAEHQALAELYASRLERLSPLMRTHWPRIPTKTIIVLNDRTDVTNGFATFLPYPYIMIYPVLPSSMDTIGEYDDWAWELLVHEYTHVLSFEQRRGVVRALSWLFGNIITPNGLLPSWWLEGVAVESETQFSRAGRLRSRMQEASLRALTLSGKLGQVRLREANEAEIPSWPYGGRPYLFGSLLWSELIAAYGLKNMGELHDQLGGRAPYFISGVLSDSLKGATSVDLFQQAQNNAKKEAEAQLAELNKVPVTAGTTVDAEMRESLSPALSPDGLKLAYVGRNQVLRRRVQVLVRGRPEEAFSTAHRISNFGKDWDANLPGSLPRRDGHDHSHDHDAPPGGNINRISWHPSSNSFVFDQVTTKNRYEEFSNLWVFQLSTGKSERITTDGRAREPSYSPDGKKIAFVLNGPSRTALAIYDVESKTTRIEYQPELQARVSFPSWLDSQRIIFSLRQSGEEQALIKTLERNELQRVLTPWKDPLFFNVFNDRALFTSTQNGVRNLYTATPDLKIVKPVTHSATQVFTSTYDRGTRAYYYTEINENGFVLRSVPEEDTARLPPDLPKIQRLWADRYPASTAETMATSQSETAGSTSQNSQKYEPRDYSPYGYLWPRYWLPFFGLDAQGMAITASTSGQDPLSKHAYAMTASYDTSINQGGFVASYSNRIFWPTITLSGSDLWSRGATASLLSHVQQAQLVASWEIASVSPDWMMGAGYLGLRQERLNGRLSQHGPVVLTSYSSSGATPAQVTPEGGWNAFTIMSRRQLVELPRANFVADVGFVGYWSRFLPKRNALMLRLLGRYSDQLLDPTSLEQTTSLIASSSVLAPIYIMRGYAPGSFLVRNLVNPVLEYRFPITRLDVGPDTMPFYFRRLHGAIVADALVFDGLIFDANTIRFSHQKFSNWFWNAGIEGRMDMNVGYHIPLTFFAGVYWPMSIEYLNSNTPQFAFGLSL